MKNLGSTATSAKNFGMDWGGAISSVLVSFGKAKEARKAYKQADKDIAAARTDAAKFTGETVESYRDIVEDFVRDEDFYSDINIIKSAYEVAKSLVNKNKITKEL